MPRTGDICDISTASLQCSSDNVISPIFIVPIKIGRTFLRRLTILVTVLTKRRVTDTNKVNVTGVRGLLRFLS